VLYAGVRGAGEASFDGGHPNGAINNRRHKPLAYP